VATTEDLTQWRKAERSRLLALRAAMPQAEHREKTAAITRFLVAGFELLGRGVIGYCWPFKSEPDPRFAVRRFRDHGARAALPVVVAKQSPLEFREWWPGVATSRGVFDLPVPEGSAVVRPDALLVPPVGFDEGGYRLGYGGGYFDRTLASIQPQPLAVAVAFEICRMPTIHPQSYDIPMDFIVTECGIYRVSAGGLSPVAPERANDIALEIIEARAQMRG
jgi:5,10-methenyltetrahydrofolate synthetase